MIVLSCFFQETKLKFVLLHDNAIADYFEDNKIQALVGEVKAESRKTIEPEFNLIIHSLAYFLNLVWQGRFSCQSALRYTYGTIKMASSHATHRKVFISSVTQMLRLELLIHLITVDCSEVIRLYAHCFLLSGYKNRSWHRCTFCLYYIVEVIIQLSLRWKMRFHFSEFVRNHNKSGASINYIITEK